MGRTKSKEIDMLNGPLYKKMLFFMVPIILSSMLQLLFNAADVIVVGRFAGGDSLAAVGATSATVALVVNFFVGFTVGINYVVAKDYVSKTEKEVQKDVHTAIASSLIFGIAVGILGIFGSRTLLRLINTPDNIIDLASLYLSIYFSGLPAIALYNSGASIVRSVGETKGPMYYLIAAGVLNVILNLFFVIVMKMNVEGVAIATTVSNYLSCVLMMRSLIREEGSLRLDLRKLTIDRRSLAEIVDTGVPSAVQSSMYGITNILIQSAINSLGTVVIAGSAAASSIENFVYLLSSISGNVMMTFMSQNVGAKKYSRIELVMKTATILCALITLGGGIILFVFREQLIGLYTSDPEIMEVGCYRLRFISLLMWLDIIMGCYSGALRGLGKAKQSMLISICAICGFRVLWIATVFSHLVHEYIVILVAWPISWVLIIIIDFFYYKRVRNTFPREDESEVLSEVNA